MVQELDPTALKEKIRGGPIVIDFWASWCGPCKSLAPIFERLSGQFDGRLAFGKINVEQNGEVTGQFGITGIPCMIIFRNGQEVTRIIGLHSEPALKEKLNEALKL